MNDLFTTQQEAERATRREQILQHSWAVWGWPGPTVGGLCEIGQPIVETPEGGTLYCSGEQARLVEQISDGLWLARIEMGEVHGKTWFKDGREVILDRDSIGPPRRQIRAARAGAAEART